MSVTESESKTVAPSPTIAPAPAPAWMSRLEAGLLRRILIVGALCVLVMIGLFLTNVSHLHARYYWSAMFPIFGIVCLWHELTGSGGDPSSGLEANPAAGAPLAWTDRRGADNFPATGARADGR